MLYKCICYTIVMKDNRKVLPDIHLYTGIEKSKMYSDRVTVTIILEAQNAKPVMLPGKAVSIPEERRTEGNYYHFILLKALEYGIQAIHEASSQPFRVVFHPNNDRIFFEYSREREEDGRFSSTAYDLDVWEQIEELLNLRGSELVIENRDSCLAYLGKLNRR